MSRYTEKYWNNDFPGKDLITGIATAGLSTLMQDDGTTWGCEIKDHETDLIGFTSRMMISKTRAYEEAWADLMEKQQEYYNDIEIQKSNSRQSRLTDYIPSPRIEGDDTGLIGLMIKGIGYILGVCLVLWLAFAVALPLILINTAIITLILGFSIFKEKKYFFAIPVLGAIYLLFDYSKGWLTQTIVGNVSFLSGLLPFFLYLNIGAGLVAAYFLIRDYLDEIQPPNAADGEYSKRNLIIMGALLAIGGAGIGLQKYFGSSNQNVLLPDIENATIQTLPIEKEVSTKKLNSPIQDVIYGSMLEIGGEHIQKSSHIQIPNSNIITITVNKDNKIFLGFDNQNLKTETLSRMGEKFEIQFTNSETERFGLMESFGTSMNNLKQLISNDLTASNLQKGQSGIPCDSSENELFLWIYAARYIKPEIQIIVKGKGIINFGVIDQIIGSLSEMPGLNKIYFLDEPDNEIIKKINASRSKTKFLPAL